LNDFHSQRKITRPALPVVHLHREETVQLLHNVFSGTSATDKESFALYKLILLHAPAGYGKTTLLVDFAQQTSLPFCWYFLDQTDTDRITFLTFFLLSIRQCFPDFGRELDPLLTGSPSERANNPQAANYFEMVVDALMVAIETEIHEPFAFILCNYQEINKFPELNDLIGSLLQKLPKGCLLIIESRIIPSLDFAHLLIHQMIFGIGIKQLRFTTQEIRELARIQNMEPLNEAEAEHLVLTFDGWIAGILLGTRLSNVQQFPRNLPALLSGDGTEHEGASQYLFSYVVNEVFQSHQNVYTFLKEASVLQEMLPVICAELLDISPSEAYDHLHYLEQQGLFVTHSGEGPEAIYTCTPVLRKLFFEELRHETPERFSQLHQRAANLLSASHNYRQAIYHALEANLHDSAANLILESSEQMMNQGHSETLALWLDAFTPATMTRYPKLLLIRTNIYLQQGNYSQALPLLDAADTAVKALASHTPSLASYNLPALQAEITIAQSKVLFQHVEYEQSRILCQQVLDSLSADEFVLRAEAHMRIGMCHILQGNFTVGIAQLQKALQLWGRHTIQRQTADVHSALATAYGLLGNFALAEHHISRGLACWNQLQDIWGKIDNLVRLGTFKMRQGTFSEAETIFQEVLTLARGPAHFQRGEAYALASLGELYQRQERYELALKSIEEALTLGRRLKDPYLINGTLCTLSIIYLYMGDIETALILISEVDAQTKTGDPIGYKQAIRDLIYGTIYLYQRQYAQARPFLYESEATLSKVGLKEEHLQALLRLASYHIAQGQIDEAVKQIKTAATIIPMCDGYEQLALMEIRYFPALQQVIQTCAELAQVRILFHLEPEIEATPAREESLPAQTQKRQEHLATNEPSARATIISHSLTILAMGEPVVSIHQEPVTHWRMARAMELCFYLIDCGRPMRKESIITDLWPEADDQTIRTFYSTIYYLRQALGGESVIVAKNGTYTLRLDVLYGNDVWYDVAEFENYQTKARQAINAEDDEGAKTAYLGMIDLYRGDYVQLFYSNWCTSRRDELRNAYLKARQQLAQIAWRQEQFDESIVHWQKMLAIDNWIEEAHYGLMRCYARQGKRGLALRQYQRCKDTLQQEFGTTPRPSIQNFYQRLMGSL
jgi:LuxR family transcriptional regulator, maltose regulon positive regulatory protein